MSCIRKYRREDARAVASLISQSFARFNSRGGTKRGIRDYVESYCPDGKSDDGIHQRLSRTPHSFVGVSDSKIVGVARGRENRLVNLFVDGDYHRQGIATCLNRNFEEACLKSGFAEIVVRSGLYAIPFYESQGYKKTTGVRNFHGLKVQPMRKQLK